MKTQEKPRYQQLKEMIIGRIMSGELQPRDRVPSENELVDAMNVSRMTANRALRELTDEGYVDRVAGRGTYVSEFKAASHVLKVRNIADEVERRGHVYSAIVHKQESQAADGEIRDALLAPEGGEVFHVLLVHQENGVPIQLEDRYILGAFAPDCLEQDFTKITPSAWLNGIAPLAEAEHIVRATMPGKTVRDRLGMDEQEPCLLVLRRTWARGSPVSFARLHHPGQRFELTGHYTPPGMKKSITADVIELKDLRR
jgi:GntR family transcriptional regulator, histidine utilization repressor